MGRVLSLRCQQALCSEHSSSNSSSSSSNNNNSNNFDSNSWRGSSSSSSSRRTIISRLHDRLRDVEHQCTGTRLGMLHLRRLLPRSPARAVEARMHKLLRRRKRRRSRRRRRHTRRHSIIGCLRHSITTACRRHLLRRTPTRTCTLPQFLDPPRFLDPRLIWAAFLTRRVVRCLVACSHPARMEACSHPARSTASLGHLPRARWLPCRCRRLRFPLKCCHIRCKVAHSVKF
mmetsp:Transcript_7996/g.21011  ORF Transcript_7996/g.21011 Transcript_7996/m.21011 type:complete len:231 (-) Transcript_7996:635-1327(-)